MKKIIILLTINILCVVSFAGKLTTKQMREDTIRINALELDRVIIEDPEDIARIKAEALAKQQAAERAKRLAAEKAAAEKLAAERAAELARKQAEAPIEQNTPEQNAIEDLKEKYPNLSVNTERIIVSENVLNFDFDKWNVKPQYDELLTDLVKFINDNNYYIDLVGYTDSIGTEEYNQVLSMRRAESVKDKLLKLGIEPSRILSVTGKGESDPVATNSTSQGRAENRRLIIFLKK